MQLHKKARGSAFYPFCELARQILHGVHNVDLHEVHGFREALLELGQVHWIVLEIGLQ